MAYPRVMAIAIVGLFIAAPQVQASDPVIPETVIRAGVRASLPDWWQVDAFEVLGSDEGLVAPPGKVPTPVPPLASMGNGPNDGGKPGMAPAAQQRIAFSATLRLSEQIYEPLYALGGTAMVREIMDADHLIHVTGSLAVSGEGDAIEFGAMRMNQAGIEDLGRPLAAFDLPAIIEGSEEAEVFFAGRERVRAQGTMNKIMGDAGDEL